MSKVILGIDVSKNELSVALLIAEKYRYKCFDNNKIGHQSLLKWTKMHSKQQVEVCLEATGSYGEEIADFLYEAGYIVKVINPLQIKSFAKAKLARHKTDKIDARLIAEYGSKFDAIPYEPIASEHKELRSLYRCSQSLKEQITYCINHLENQHLLPKVVLQVWEDTKAGYLAQLEIVNARISAIIDHNAEMKQNIDNLLSVKGIGQETAIAVIAELPRIKSFTSARQLAAFIGLTPKQHSSGSSVNGKAKISKMGVGTLRKALFFPAMSAMRFNEYLKAVAEKLTARGKAKKAIICAIMRKLVHIIYGILKHQEPFNIQKLVREENFASAQTVVAL